MRRRPGGIYAWVRSTWAFTLALSVSLPAQSAEELTAPTTSHIAVPRKKRRPPTHPIRSGAHQLHHAIKQTSPNPRVQGGSTPAMPPQAPPLPKPPKPPAEPPKSGTERFFNGAAKIMTKSWGQNIFVWLPAISTDPNTGPTIGLMPVLVLADPVSHHIRHLLAPSYTYNSLFGQTVTGRYYFYPTESSQLYATASYSQRTNREIKGRYENTDALEGVLYLRAEAYQNVDASPRFFGLGPQTHEGDEAGYTAKASSIRGAVGVNFANAWRATTGMRLLRFKTEPTIIPNTQDLAARFPTAPGLGLNNTVTNELRLLWDTRDSPITPSRGSSGEAFVEKTSHAMGSDADFVRFGLEGRRLFPWKGGKRTTVIHGLYDQANGSFIPFYDLPSVGGRTTLRGYGEGRLTDRGRLVLNIEQRFTVASLSLMNIQTNFELAPFIDVGTVFPTLPEIQRKNLRPVFGGAFRAAVKPNVVGDVEVGIGREGPAVFVDINYPF